MNEPSTISEASLTLLEGWRLRERNRKAALEIAEKALQHESNDSLLYAQARVITSYIAFRNGNMLEVLEQTGQAILVFRKHYDIVWLARALNNQACAALELGELAPASLALEEQLELSKQAKDLELEGCALHDLGMMKLLQSHEQAQPYLQAAFEVFQRAHSLAGQAYALVNLATVFEAQGKLNQAHQLLEQALEIIGFENMPTVEDHIYVRLGSLAIQQGNFDHAQQVLSQALEQSKQNRERILWEAVPAMVKVHLHFERPALAIELIQTHLEIVHATGLRPFEVSAHELLAQLFESIGDDRSALHHYREYMRLHRQVFQETSDLHARALKVLEHNKVAALEAENERQKNLELQSNLEHLERLHQQTIDEAYTDELTGVRNRRYLMTHGADQLREKKGKNCSVAIIDLDHFKRINDTHGHDTGDQVLREFVQIGFGTLRSQDTLARFGGEEFVVLLPDTSTKIACEVLERIRKTLANHVWKSLPEGQRVSFTAGVSDGANGDLNLALQQADVLLYQGKSQGRNQIICHEKIPS